MNDGPAANRRGVLLIQLGTPDAPTTAAVRRYLREFLGDPRVLDVPAPLRWLLLQLVILPFRPRRSARQYRSIWLPEGSPLRLHSEATAAALARHLGPAWVVALAMRYGRPTIAAALEQLVGAGVGPIDVVPLFPQYASSSTGSALERTLRLAGARVDVPALRLHTSFEDHPGFIDAQAARARAPLARFAADHVLLSYHGLPERHVRASDPTGRHCLARADCCDAPVAANRYCYRAHCAATSRALAARLGLAPGRWSMSFQSRLGRDPWILPDTESRLTELAQGGCRRLAVLCPSFVADCLETLEEIGIRARARWAELGGEELLLVPCVNDHPDFVAALASMVGAPGPPAHGASAPTPG